LTLLEDMAGQHFAWLMWVWRDSGDINLHPAKDLESVNTHSTFCILSAVVIPGPLVHLCLFIVTILSHTLFSPLLSELYIEIA